ncbi:hypothetical protein K438DRAFT_1969468 [Mycena galopus ATCC 62051]|nr:hypothetical protein K438DRAFT_1969468 [Mycena galopus ATCC 62051]
MASSSKLYRVNGHFAPLPAQSQPANTAQIALDCAAPRLSTTPDDLIFPNPIHMAPAPNTINGSQATVKINAQLTLILAAIKPDRTLAPVAPVPAPEPQNTLPLLVMPQSQPQFTPPSHHLTLWQLLVDASDTVGMGFTKLRTYKTLNSVTFPLHVYFAILGAHLRSVAPSVYFWPYITHIESLALEYEWSAVFEYHTLFFDLRQEDMLGWLYNNWGSPDANLLCVHIYPFKKVAKVVKNPSTK